MKNQPTTPRRNLRLEGYFWFVMFAATIFAANYFIRNIGTECHGTADAPVCLIPMWPAFFGDGFAPSGVLLIGFAFTFRDLVQRRLGLKWAWGAVLTGAVLSGLLDPALAFASAAAFLLAESLDLLVYTPLQRRNLFLAVIASNIVGIAVDSFVFLYLAGIPLMFIEGQIVGKFYMTLLALPVIWWIRRRDVRSGLVVTPNGQTVWPDEPLTA